MTDENCPDLHDALPTINFIRWMNKVIMAMTSRTPYDALSLNDGCKKKKVNFIKTKNIINLLKKTVS